VDNNVVVGMTAELEYSGAWHEFEVVDVRKTAHPHFVRYSSEPIWKSEWITLDTRTNRWGKRGFLLGKIRFIQKPLQASQANQLRLRYVGVQRRYVAHGIVNGKTKYLASSSRSEQECAKLAQQKVDQLVEKGNDVHAEYGSLRASIENEPEVVSNKHSTSYLFEKAFTQIDATNKSIQAAQSTISQSIKATNNALSQLMLGPMHELKLKVQANENRTISNETRININAQKLKGLQVKFKEQMEFNAGVEALASMQQKSKEADWNQRMKQMSEDIQRLKAVNENKNETKQTSVLGPGKGNARQKQSRKRKRKKPSSSTSSKRRKPKPRANPKPKPKKNPNRKSGRKS